MNSVQLIGRLTKDAELRYVGEKNTACCNFTIALDDGYGDKKKSYFILCTSWGNTAELISKKFVKGDQIAIEGKLTQENYEINGEKKSKTGVTVNNITFVGPKKDTQEKPIDYFKEEPDTELPWA